MFNFPDILKMTVKMPVANGIVSLIICARESSWRYAPFQFGPNNVKPIAGDNTNSGITENQSSKENTAP